ncbi:MAG: C25 family cysteine peptidase [Candidatus Thermoplasmatota archaeon]
MIQMNRKITILSMLTAFVLIATSFSAIGDMVEEEQLKENSTRDYKVTSTLTSDMPAAIAVSDSNPFYALIATPLAVHYNEEGNQTVIPLYVKDFNDPSKAVERAEQQIGIEVDFVISDIFTPKEISLSIAGTFWEESNAALLIKDDKQGYELGMVATPLASYLSIPVIVTDDIDMEVTTVLDDLGVENIYICGDLTSGFYNVTKFNTEKEIRDECIEKISERFDETVGYITMANPLDVSPPAVLDSEVYFFSETIASGIFLPTQAVSSIFNDAFAIHEFNISEDYKYANVKFDLENLDSEHAQSLGDRITLLLNSPEPDSHRYLFASTAGGLPARDSDGYIITDQLHYEITIYDKPGTYNIQVFAQWFSLRKGSYSVKVTVEKLDSSLVPLMDNLSSIAPYLTAYHKGIVFAKPEFAFAADDDVLYNGTTCPGVSQPGTNPNLIEPSNEHTMAIHDELISLLAQIAEIPEGNIEELRDHYAENPMYIAISADPTMIPMYFYFNPDGKPDNPSAYMMGFALPSDFMYGDIDPKLDDPENNTYTYWPFQENIVGRVTGQDVQDCSALIARTIFYNNIIDDLGEWKNNALVQTGCGLEFQNLPILTRLSHLLYEGRGEPTKFPTGESSFINMKLKESMQTGAYDVKNTFFLQSQREGFSSNDLKQIKNAGLLNRLLFPKSFIYFLNSDVKVTGGDDQLNSNIIFTFAHGSYNLYEHGDVFIDSRGFPFVTAISRVYPSVRSGLSSKGTFDIRSVENMEYGPSVIFVQSCITGRTDGISGENVLSQTYLHAGANVFIGATRVTADPGYLEPRPLPGGWGIGILGLTKAILDLKLRNKYPDLHFGAVIAEDFILELTQNNTDTGLALRNAKNKYLEKDANSTFLWTPPLTLSTGCNIIDQEFFDSVQTGLFGNDRSRVLDKKYVALHEFILYGDPAFNPYQPCNEG